MTDFAAIGIQVDSRPVVEGTKALDALGEASARVEQKIRVSNGQMSDTSKLMQAQADQAKAAAQANAVLGGSTSALTAGQAQLIERFREQAATVGMSRSQLMAYQAAQLGVTEQTREAVAAVKAHEDALKAASQAKADAAKSTNFLTDALKLLAAGYAALKIGEFVKDSAMQAARFETLGVVMEVVGRNAGYTKTQMNAASEGIARQGITMLEARESAVKLVQAHVDLQHAEGLARIAQNAAVIGHMNSSEAFDRLVNGIARGNVLILRNIGINVNLQAAYQQMADSLGKTTKELTENERVEARRIAVFERGVDINDVYTKSMDTAGKQILSMQRYVSDLKTVFGETFNEVLTVAVMGLTSGLKDANGEVSQLAKNNQLMEWGHGLATIFVGIADAVGNAYTAIQKFDAFARHKDAQKVINEDFDAQSKKNFSEGSLLDLGGVRSRGQRIEAMRQSALAQENADYEAQQAVLSGHFDRFSKEYKVFNDGRIAKQKEDAAARLKVDQDYEAAATAIMMKAANGNAAAQKAASREMDELYKKTYVGTPSFRDTEGRESKPTIDRADSARLQNKLARLQEESAIDKEYANYEMQLDDMRRKAGELGDEQYAKNRKESLQTIFISEQVMYDKELTALRAHHNSTDEEREKNRKAIDDILGKQNAAQTKYSHDTFAGDEAERLRKKSVEEASQDASNKYISGLNAEAEKLEQSNGAHEKSRSAIERETVARLDLAIAYQQQFMAEQAISGANREEVEQGKVVLKFLQDMRDARERIASAAATQESDLFSKRAADQAIQDWQRAGASIADSLSKGFGAGGKAAGDMLKAVAEGQAGQLRAQKDLAAAKKLSDDNPEKVNAINRAQLNGSQAQLKSYGDMATAAQGFFDQGSRGYKAMAAASDVLRLAEVGLSLVKGVNAVLTQGEGDPYSAFARMAAMAAIVTGLGVALTGGSGGGGMSAADRQKAQGTGSVLGDSDAKSESLKRALDAVEKNTYQGLQISGSMLATLRSIDTNITSFASQLVRTTDITNPNLGPLNSNNGGATTTFGVAAGAAIGAYFGPIGAAIGAFVGLLAKNIPIIGKIATSIFGGKQSVEDSGFTMDSASLASILSGGVKASQYADIKTSGGWFSSDKTSSQATALGAATNQQFTAIITSLAGSVKTAGELLGISGDDFTAKLNSFVVDIGKVSLKDLKGADLQKALESVFSKLGDDMAQFAVGGLTQFQQVGEGYLETLVRVAAEYQSIDVVFQSFGKTFGEVDLASIGARDRLVQLAGGLDKFTSQGEYFLTNFFSEKEQAAALKSRVQPVLDQYGLQASGEGAMRALRDFVVCLDTTTEAGAQAYTTLMQYAPAVKQIADAEKGVLDERKGLQDQVDQLTMTSIQLRMKERAGIDAANLSLYDYLQTLKDQATALQTTKDAAAAALGNVDNMFSVLQRVAKGTTDTLTARINAEKSLSDAVKSTLSSMKAQGSEASTRAAAQAQVQAALAIAKAGGPLPDAAAMQKAFSTLSQDASSMFATQQDYLKDFYSTQNDIASLGDLADSSLSVDQKQLDSLNSMLAAAQQQIDLLKGIDVSGLTIAQALAGFKGAVSTAQANPIVGATPGIVDLYQSLLGRAPDQAGLQFWQDSAAKGVSLDVMRQDFMKSDEYKHLHGVPGFAGGGDFGGGLRIVGENGPELEATGPSRIWSSNQTAALLSRASSGNSDALVTEIKALRETVAAQQKVLDKIAKNTGDHKDMFDNATAGGGPLLVEFAQ